MLFLHTHLTFLLDSDMSSELILSKLLVTEKTILTHNWYYSTELRVLNTQLVYSFFFKLFSGWHRVRWLSILSMIIMMLAACCFLFSQLKMRELFWVAATILVLPFSKDYFNFVLKGAYYFPHIIVSFVSVGLIELQISMLGKKKKTLVLLLLFTLSFIAGLGGPRQVIIVYIPALLAGLFLLAKEIHAIYLEKHNIRCCFSKIQSEYLSYGTAVTLAFIGSVTGYYINSNVFRKKYEFYYYDIYFAGFDFSRLNLVLNGFFNGVGYTNGEVLSLSLVNNAISIIWTMLTALAIIYALRHSKDISPQYYRFSALTAFSYMFFTALYLFTNLEYRDRYNIPIVVFSIPCILLYFKTVIRLPRFKYIPALVMALLIIIRSVGFYEGVAKTDSTYELRKIVHILSDNGYREGYATFWNANVITELSNGNIEVWNWGDYTNDFGCIDQVHEWLQLKSHVYEHPDGKVFWVLTEDQNNKMHFTKNLSAGHLIYRTPEEVNWDILDDNKKIGTYFVYGFSCYEEMYNLVGLYDFSNERILESGEKTVTEKKILYPDEYTIIICGENLRDCTVNMTYNPYVEYKRKKKLWTRPHEIIADSISIRDKYVVCKFNIADKVNNFQLSISNEGTDEVIITDIKILKNNIYYADFYSSKYLEQGFDRDGVRYLKDGGISYGPYISLVPGTYHVECYGNGLNSISFDAIYRVNDQTAQFDITKIDLSNNHLSYEFEVKTTRQNCEIRFINNSGSTVELEHLRLQRE